MCITALPAAVGVWFVPGALDGTKPIYDVGGYAVVGGV